MDLKNFEKKVGNNEKSTKEILVDNNGLKLSLEDNQHVFLFSNTKAVSQYQDFLFFSPTNAILPETEKELEKFFQKSKDDGVEGLMVKKLSATYKPGIRTGAMAKLKETMEDLDLVIVGAEHGTGKRAGFYSSFIVAIRNPNSVDESDEFLEIGKVSSGVKELGDDGPSLSNINSLLAPLKLKETNLGATFTPKIILQVRYQEIQKSTIYASGYALRFPRIISLRDDKPLDEVNTTEDVKRLVK